MCWRRTRGSAFALVLALLAACGTTGADKPAPAEGSASAGPGGERCEFGCLRWSETCNVDPRGAYKCQRTCQQLGEICE